MERLAFLFCFLFIAFLILGCVGTSRGDLAPDQIQWIDGVMKKCVHAKKFC